MARRRDEGEEGGKQKKKKRGSFGRKLKKNKNNGYINKKTKTKKTSNLMSIGENNLKEKGRTKTDKISPNPPLRQN